MTLADFKNTLSQESPPQGISEILVALWYDANQQWDSAHDIAQSQEGTQPYDRLHAYLHRVEGDQWNANYWYNRAKSKMPQTSLAEEWESLVMLHLNS
jgi:hypothetical protein